MTTQPTKRPRGRPTIPPDEARSARIDARVTPEQRAKYERLGGPAWLRRQIERAKESKLADGSTTRPIRPSTPPA
jgi:hypothetical protein